MEGETAFTEITVEGHADPFHIYVEWEDNEFTVTLLDITNSTAYKGQMSQADLEKWSADKKQSISEYLEDTKMFFVSGNLDNKDENTVSFAIDDSVFSWKRVIDKDMKLKCGSVKVNKVNFTNTVSSLVSYCTSQIRQMENANTVLTKEKDELNKEKMELLQKLDDYEKSGLKMEEELYSKFLAVLNAKKERILSLQEMIDNQEKIVQAQEHNPDRKPLSPEDADDPKPLSDYDSYSGDTDVDSDEEQKRATMEKATNILKRKIAAVPLDDDDDDLFGSDDDSGQSGNVITRRVKPKGTQGKSLTVLPPRRGAERNVPKKRDKIPKRSLETEATLLIDQI